MKLFVNAQLKRGRYLKENIDNITAFKNMAKENTNKHQNITINENVWMTEIF